MVGTVRHVECDGDKGRFYGCYRLCARYGHTVQDTVDRVQDSDYDRSGNTVHLGDGRIMDTVSQGHDRVVVGLGYCRIR